MSTTSLAIVATFGALYLLVAGGWLVVRLRAPAARGVVSAVLVVCLAPFVAVLVLAGLFLSGCTGVIQRVSHRHVEER
jgi:multisubunit Na+/H+ antiporter MnhG subunit